MSRSILAASRRAVLPLAAALVATTPLPAQGPPQAIDVEYTAKIKEYLTDPRISTELVDHLPASSTVPTPLKFLGRIVGTPGELTYAKDIHRYLAAIAASSPRAKYWSIGKTEEGRDIVVLAIADSATLAQLDRYKGMLNELTDPRRTSEARAQELLGTAKPIYWLTSGMHSPERGGPETLMELAYRLVVQETPFIREIRNNVITFITPVLETDGREKMVDTYYWNKKYGADGNLPLMYWGKYVQHDNNRDGMGQYLALTKHTTRTFVEWTPTVLHDLHEAATYLYSSTGTGPYNEAIDPITVDEWWLLAKSDVMEMTKRGVPGVWTYGFYDGWTPNYMFFIAHTHNAIGRFYEVQSYGPDNYVQRTGATTTSREWFRPNPPLAQINWGPRANVNIQQSGVLFSLSRMARDRKSFLENYWLKNKRAVEKGRTGAIKGWIVPASQHARANAAEAVNDLRRQGLEFHVATAPFTAGHVQVQKGDWIVRGDQPYRTLAEMYFSLQNFPVANPSPYDDTGWTFPLMRNMTITPVGDAALLAGPMAPVTADVRAAGGITGRGNVVVVPATRDNALVSLRFRLAKVPMRAADAAFDVAGRRFAPGAFLIPNANRAQLDPILQELGLEGVAIAALPKVAMHDLDVPRIGYIHSWSRTQDEGWVRAAFDHYGVPYTYFGEPVARTGNLRAKFDVIVYPHGGSGIGGAVAADGKPVPYQRTAEFPNIGYPDSTSDIRGGLGVEGMKALYEFVQQGGTLITEGSTAPLFISSGLLPAAKVETAPQLFARGTILRGVLADRASPLTYGYEHAELPVYFNQSPIINVGNLPPATLVDGPGGAPGRGGTITPMAFPLTLSSWDPTGSGLAYGSLPAAPDAPAAAPAAAGGRGAGGRGAGGAGGRGGAGGATALAGVVVDSTATARVVLAFPAKADQMLLSGTLQNGELLANRAQLVDASIGKGHLVMFAIRPFWRWQTQGTYSLGFNALLHWNDLSVGK
jgi:hypothetical protein